MSSPVGYVDAALVADLQARVNNLLPSRPCGHHGDAHSMHVSHCGKFSSKSYLKGWFCDRCRYSGSRGEERWHCDTCVPSADFCFNCIPKTESAQPANEKLGVRAAVEKIQTIALKVIQCESNQLKVIGFKGLPFWEFAKYFVF